MLITDGPSALQSLFALFVYSFFLLFFFPIIAALFRAESLQRFAEDNIGYHTTRCDIMLGKAYKGGFRDMITVFYVSGSRHVAAKFHFDIVQTCTK